jgi:HEAT repeat protein
MKTETSNKQYLKQIIDSGELLIKSELIRLASLDNDEFDFLKNNWDKAEVKRRRKIVVDVQELSQEHASLDFSRLFDFWLDDADAGVRAEAVKSLIDEEDPFLTERFIGLLHGDSSAGVRAAAAAALGKLALQGELGKLSSEKTNVVYQALLQTLDKKTESVKVKAAALPAIAPLNLPRVKGLIEGAYHSDNPELKISAIQAMGLNCNRTWLNALLEELPSDDPEIRLAAVAALGELLEEDAVLHLIEMVKDEFPRIQEAAIKAIGDIGGKEARQLLTMLLDDPQSRIRRAARLALQEIDFCENPLPTNF